MLPPRHHKAANKAFWHYWPRRFISERGLMAILLILAVILMGLSQFSPQLSQRIRGGVFNGLSGILEVMAIPAKKTTNIVEHVTGLSDMATDLAGLRAEIYA